MRCLLFPFLFLHFEDIIELACITLKTNVILLFGAIRDSSVVYRSSSSTRAGWCWWVLNIMISYLWMYKYLHREAFFSFTVACSETFTRLQLLCSQLRMDVWMCIYIMFTYQNFEYHLSMLCEKCFDKLTTVVRATQSVRVLHFLNGDDIRVLRLHSRLPIGIWWQLVYNFSHKHHFKCLRAT